MKIKNAITVIALTLGLAACMGSPLNATLWLARTMARAGRPLQPGDLVLSGALGPAFGVASQDQEVALVLFEVPILPLQPRLPAITHEGPPS